VKNISKISYESRMEWIQLLISFAIHSINLEYFVHSSALTTASVIMKISFGDFDVPVSNDTLEIVKRLLSGDLGMVFMLHFRKLLDFV
jgi:hypothetical protein